jgi:hypothetical protein
MQMSATMLGTVVVGGYETNITTAVPREELRVRYLEAVHQKYGDMIPDTYVLHWSTKPRMTNELGNIDLSQLDACVEAYNKLATAFSENVDVPRAAMWHVAFRAPAQAHSLMGHCMTEGIALHQEFAISLDAAITLVARIRSKDPKEILIERNVPRRQAA